MLTATYSMVAIATEQNSLRRNLAGLHQCVQKVWQGIQSMELSCLESAFQNLSRLDHLCHRRKVERFLIPALRHATREADPLIAELDRMSAAGLSILRTAGEQLQLAGEGRKVRVGEICHALALYCDNLLKRLAKEEAELLPIARRVFSIEQWFSIAEKFLGDDKARRNPERRAPQKTQAPTQGKPALHQPPTVLR